MSFGQGAGLTSRGLGETGGRETTTLLVTEMPAHQHAISAATLTATARCKNGPGTVSTPVGNIPAIEAASTAPIYSDGALDPSAHTGAFAISGTATAASTGAGLAHTNLAPYLTMNYVIATQGIFPSRS